MTMFPGLFPYHRPAPDEVLVLVAELRPWFDLCTELSRFLSAEERHRAGLFARPDLTDAYVVSHGLLRGWLGAALDCAPEAIAFRRGLYGKPELTGMRSRPGLAFNLSHTESHVAIAGVIDAEVGIDIEPASRDFAPEILELCASTDEREYLSGLAGEVWRTQVHALWTRKEALAKAAGLGLRLAFEDFTVIPAADGGAMSGIALPNVKGTFSLTDLPQWRGCGGAVALKGPLRRVEFAALTPPETFPRRRSRQQAVPDDAE